ncbi:MAG: copper resistance protein B [Candidatus Binataceae bacterium]
MSVAMLTVSARYVEAQSSNAPIPIYTQYTRPPVEDNDIFYHVLFDQLEGRTNGPNNEFRWDGEAWMGTDFNRLWLKSEGFVERGKASDGDTEALYDRPLPFMKYFDAQAGIRYDLDSEPGRAWGAVGLEGLAPYWFHVEPTFYFSNDGRVAGKFFATYDLLLTNRLILQPEIEMNFYSRDEPVRGTGSGLSDLDTGLRLRYEFIRDPAFSRKVAPYVGFAYTQAFGDAATFTREEGGAVHDPRFVYGLHVWY